MTQRAEPTGIDFALRGIELIPVRIVSYDEQATRSALYFFIR